MNLPGKLRSQRVSQLLVEGEGVYESLTGEDSTKVV